MESLFKKHCILISQTSTFLRQLIDSISWVESTCSLTRYTNTPPGAKKWKKSLICGQIWRLPSRGHRLFRFWMLMQTCRAGCSVTTWLVCRSENTCVSTSILNCPYILQTNTDMMLCVTEFTKARGRTDVWSTYFTHTPARLPPTTLKRFWGYLKNEEVQTRPHTLDVPRIHVALIFWSRTIATKGEYIGLVLYNNINEFWYLIDVSCWDGGHDGAMHTTYTERH